MIEAFCRWISTVNERVGKEAGILFVPLVLSIVTEVVLRRFFGHPTRWSWDVNLYFGALLIVLGGGYCVFHRAHVIVDVLYLRFSPRTRAIIDVMTSPFLFFSIGILLFMTVRQTGESLAGMERLPSLWQPLLWPLTAVAVMGLVLFLLQGVEKLIHDLGIAKRGGKG